MVIECMVDSQWLCSQYVSSGLWQSSCFLCQDAKCFNCCSWDLLQDFLSDGCLSKRTLSGGSTGVADSLIFILANWCPFIKCWCSSFLSLHCFWGVIILNVYNLSIHGAMLIASLIYWCFELDVFPLQDLENTRGHLHLAVGIFVRDVENFWMFSCRALMSLVDLTLSRPPCNFSLYRSCGVSHLARTLKVWYALHSRTFKALAIAWHAGRVC